MHLGVVINIFINYSLLSTQYIPQYGIFNGTCSSCTNTYSMLLYFTAQNLGCNSVTPFFYAYFCNRNKVKKMASDNKELLDHLSGFVKERRWALFNKIIENRTRYLTVALENIYQPHNASAVLRSADCFGLQDIHIIENDNEYQVNPDVALGASKWLNMYSYNKTQNNTPQAVAKLKADGYRIVATTPHTHDVALQDFDLTKGKTALFFGTELTGLSDEMLSMADEFVKIPMYGFTESFNISVSAALIMHTLTDKLRNSDIKWQLTDEDKTEVMLDWVRKTIKASDAIEARFNNNRS